VSDFTKEDDALLEELGVEVETQTESLRSARDERIITGFEDVQDFTAHHGGPPQHGEKRDIFERLYAVRLDCLRALPDCRAVLAPLDHQQLLGVGVRAVDPIADLDDDELLAQLGVDVSATGMTDLQHVRSAAEKRAAEEIATRRPCEDFAVFEPLFAQVRNDLDSGARETRRFQATAEIKKGEFFIVGGQIAYIADIGDEFITEYDRRDSRLRVIYDNGTESDVLLRSLQRALYRDEAGRHITDLSAGPLFAGESEEGDLVSGTIYALRSKSDHPTIAANRNVLHKIGVTGGDVERRIANADLDPTYLMADVEVVATYKLANLNRTKLENLIHRIFGSARLDIEIKDRFGNTVVPSEWFLVPLFVIDEAIEKIRDGSIVDFAYDPSIGKLVRRKPD
jgi:Meiotically up-regulated gene 113